jgi:uncharacterized protein YjeT (DUF2065 family)
MISYTETRDHSADSVLGSWLLANGVFSFMTGSTTLVFGGPISDYMSINDTLLRIVGLGLVLFGSAIVWLARRDELDLRLARMITLADITWVVGALALVFVLDDLMSDGGRILLGLVSLPVLVFALGQYVGIKMMSE